MRHLDLFSGIGGFALAARWVGWETVGFCEISPYCQKVLRRHWPDVPIYEDVNDFDGRKHRGVGILTAGVPCQPYSVAGKQRGEADDRNLWPQFLRVVSEVRPAWIVGENVPGFARLGLDQVSLKLESFGYSVQTLNIPACAVNAPHRRERLWIVAHTERSVERTKPRSRKAGRVGREQQPFPWNRSWEDAIAHARRVDDGLSGRMVTDRTDSIRNAIVPQVAEVIFRAIDAIDRSKEQ